MKFDFPEDMRPATVDEREQFYREEFETTNLERLMQRWPQFIPVVDVGSESTLYRPRFKEYKGKLVRISDYTDVDQLKEKFIEYAPEDLYYKTRVEREDRIETNPEQELVFDLDPERTDCKQCERRRTYLDDKEAKYRFCMNCFATVAKETRQLYSFLENHFDSMQLVYSGRGFHIHVMDDTAFKMDREDRRELASKVASQFPVDAKVTAGEVDMVRLPGSLHGLVSRKVIPVSLSDLTRPERIITHKAVPEFLDL